MRDPASWLVVEPGWEVLSTDGERLALVKQVLGDENADIFDGLAVDTGPLKKPTYVPAERVQLIVEGRIVLDMSKSEFDALPEYDGVGAG
jgi:PRC-barrel domain